jgi:YidC/Oxa1 family membrane protein insertase
MEKRFITFLLLSFIVLTVNMMLMRWLQPPAPVAQKAVAEAEEEAEKPAEPAAEKQGAAENADEEAAQAAAPKQPAAPPPPDEPEEWFTLGSIDPASGYRELVTLVNTGAAIQRIELNSPKYLDQEDRSGYLGELDLALAAPPLDGLLVRVVGPGTPAAEAGVKPGDIITALNGKAVFGPSDFDERLERTEPGQEFQLAILRDGKAIEASGRLRRRPMAIIRPERASPLDEPDQFSFLLTMDSIDGERIEKGDAELPGLKMRTAKWKALPRAAEDEIAFQYDLPDRGLAVIKKFKLAKVDPKEADDPAAAAYHLEFAIEVRNVGDSPHKVAWRLDGPTGLPLEGAWYATRISPHWFRAAGIRDVAVGFWRNGQIRAGIISATTIAEGKDITPWQDEPLQYIGVDAQYFAVALVPEKENPQDINYARAIPIRVGEKPEDRAKINRTNVSFRLTSNIETVAPQGKPFVESYQLFAGPKKPSLLAHYGLGKLVYYGWFGWVAEPMLIVLHIFHRIIPNYGIAIIMLTVLVRSMMFPISRRQAINAQKMQELQPEIKRIQEKYKGNMEARSKAQQELFRKHNYNPLSGCLPLFLQLPIFLGLYRSLAVDVELRGAPLISESIRWCSNLAAPDMLWYWYPYLPAMLASPSGWLGPYFNLFPCITIGLFIWQQKMFMPPPADEQAAMQQKIMQYMMIFMGVMFFKVASGLCLYFIASSLWGIAERKLLPKTTPKGASPPPAASRPAVTRTGPSGNGAGDVKRKHRGRT